MFATCATPSPVRKWYTRYDVEEDGYQRFVQRGVGGMDGDPPEDIEEKSIKVGSHMLATKAAAMPLRTERLVPRRSTTSEAEIAAASGATARRWRGSLGSQWQWHWRGGCAEQVAGESWFEMSCLTGRRPAYRGWARPTVQTPAWAPASAALASSRAIRSTWTTGPSQKNVWIEDHRR